MSVGILPGIRGGVRGGIRCGLLDPLDGDTSAWDVDATSGIAMPSSAAQYAAFIAAGGLAISVPDTLWRYTESDGDLMDSIGSRTALRTGTASYQQAVAGWTKTGVKLATNDDTSWFAFTTGITSSDPIAIFGIVLMNAQGRTQSLFSLGGISGGNCLEVRSDSNSQFIGVNRDQTALGGVSYSGHVAGVFAVYRPADTQFRVYTKEKGFGMDTIDVPWNGFPSINGTSGYLHSGWNNSHNATVLTAELWTGADADIGASDVGDFFARRGF